MYVSRKRTKRAGVAAIESAIVLSVILLLLLLSLEVSVAVVRYTSLTAAARHLARVVSLHGEMAGDSNGTWGPNSLQMTANNNHPAAQAVASRLTAMNAAHVALKIEWPDGATDPGDSVAVTLTYTHQPITSATSWLAPMVFTSTSRTWIAH